MTRLKKELVKRGIIFEEDGGYEEGRSLIEVTDKYIITLWGCNVLPTQIHLFDHQYNLIAKQNLFPEKELFSNNMTWSSEVR